MFLEKDSRWRIQYEEVRRIAVECQPKMIIAGASAYARTIDFKKFREIAEAIAMMIKEGEAAAPKAKAIVSALTEKYPLK